MSKEEQIEVLNELIKAAEELSEIQRGWNWAIENGKKLLEKIKSLEE
tara:strand:- start:186 stop:326 length:141 start_codon:yes stop_codon:yes gene_type:complete